MTWAIRLSLELAKGVIGVAKAFGTSTLLLDQPSIADRADRFRPQRLTNVVADKPFWVAALRAHCWMCLQLN